MEVEMKMRQKRGREDSNNKNLQVRSRGYDSAPRLDALQRTRQI